MTARNKSMALLAAFLGWLFDGFEMGLFPLIGKPALQDLMPGGKETEQGQWFTVIIAVFLVGAATGGVLFGWIGDKMGRVKAMTLAIFTYAIFTGLCAFVKEPWQLAALRFVASLGMGGEWALGVALVNELWAGKNRAWIAGMIGAASNVGFLLVGVLSWKLNQFLPEVTKFISSLGLGDNISGYLLHNRAWRFLAVSGALPALINFFILVFVPESHKWEAERDSGKTSHWATKDLLGILLGGVCALAIIWAWSPVFHYGTGVAVAITLVGLVVASWGYLLPVRRYLHRAVAAAGMDEAHRHMVLKNLVMGATLAAIALLGTWGSVQQSMKWSTYLLPKGGVYPILDYTQMATALGAIVISLITPLVADKLGRRITYFLLCAASLAIALLFFKTNKPFEKDEATAWFLISAVLIGGISASFYGFFPLYFPELFPTSVRATGQGFCFNFGRLVAAIGSLQLGNLVAHFNGANTPAYLSSANAYCALCSVYILGLIVIWACPETKGKALE